MTPRCKECRWGVNGENNCPVEIIPGSWQASCDRYLSYMSLPHLFGTDFIRYMKAQLQYLIDSERVVK